MSLAYLNGEFLPLAAARVPVLDRGFLFGDGVYEVIPAYGGHPFRLDHHLERLAGSLAGIRMRPPLTAAEWQAIFRRLLQDHAGEDRSIYLQVTRGVGERRDHGYDDRLVPTVFAMTSPIHPPDPALGKTGVRAITRHDIRWTRCDIKAITLLANLLLRQEALDAGAAEAILLRDGLATEGAASNLFVVREGVLLTPPKGPRLLPGITRDLVLELAVANDLPCREEDITESALRQADEIWITSSTREILPVTELDGVIVGDGRPGPLYHRLHGLYQDYKRRWVAAQPAAS